MQLVGAPQAYIRGPFVMEGVLQGGCGALVALVAARRPCFSPLRARYLTPLASALSLSSHPFPAGRPLRLLVVVGGWLVGCVGGSGRGAWSLRNLDTRFAAALHWIRQRRQFISRTCMPRFVTDSRPISAQHPITEFYREEFVKHHRCLQQQRPYYSESAITDVEAALTRIMGQLEQLSTKDNAAQVVSSLLKKFDVVTGLSPGPIPNRPTDTLTRSLRHDLQAIVRAGIAAVDAGTAGGAGAGAATRGAVDGRRPPDLRRESGAGDGRRGGRRALSRDPRRTRGGVGAISAPWRTMPAAFRIDRRRPSVPTDGERARPDGGRWRSRDRSPPTRRCSCSCRAARRR